MNMATAYPNQGQAMGSNAFYEAQEQSDGQLCFQTHPASKPVFAFDSAIIIAGFAVPVLGLGYFLLGAGNYTVSLTTTLMAIGVAWLCLRVLYRGRDHGVRPYRFHAEH